MGLAGWCDPPVLLRCSRQQAQRLMTEEARRTLDRWSPSRAMLSGEACRSATLDGCSEASTAQPVLYVRRLAVIRTVCQGRGPVSASGLAMLVGLPSA